MKQQSISAEELDRLFDEGKEDVLQYFDPDGWTRPGKVHEKVSVSLPEWIVSSLDQEAARIGADRQTVIEMWLSERLSKKSA